MTIKRQLENHSTHTSQHLLQIRITKLQFKILQVVARAWGISVAELVRRSCNIVLAQLKDRAILTKIQALKLAEGSQNDER